VQELCKYDLGKALREPRVLTLFTAGGAGASEYRYVEFFLEVVKKVGSAMRYIHQIGIIHLDLKPDNGKLFTT
jgi:serine/threonine protein kinase